MILLPAFDRPFDQYHYQIIHKRVKKIVKKQPCITAIDLKSHFAAVDNEAENFSYDGLHMNDYGHKVTAEILLPIVLAASKTEASIQTH